MDIFVKQSLKCVYQSLTTDEKIYTWYTKGVDLVASHPACTKAQVNMGYLLEIVFFSTLITVIWAYFENEEKYSNPTPLLGVAALSTIFGAMTTLVVNVFVVGFAPIMSIVLYLSVLSLLGLLAKKFQNPFTLWNNLQYKKKMKAEAQLASIQKQIAQLREADPDLNIALRSLDGITTALHE